MLMLQMVRENVIKECIKRKYDYEKYWTINNVDVTDDDVCL